jgi:hypothetical protein
MHRPFRTSIGSGSSKSSSEKTFTRTTTVPLSHLLYSQALIFS